LAKPLSRCCNASLFSHCLSLSLPPSLPLSFTALSQLSHCLSLAASLTVTVSLAAPLTAAHTISRIASRCLSLTQLSHCLSYRLSHCLSRTASLTASLTVSLTASLEGLWSLVPSWSFTALSLFYYYALSLCSLIVSLSLCSLTIHPHCSLSLCSLTGLCALPSLNASIGLGTSMQFQDLLFVASVSWAGVQESSVLKVNTVMAGVEYCHDCQTTCWPV